MSTHLTTVHNLTVDGLDLFYREAGNPCNPTILLLHSYPSSSHQYRNLIPLLSPTHHILAPDLPGFGFTTVPPSRNYSYTFDSLASTISAFLSALDIKSYSVYIFGYGAPIAFRLALANPDAIEAIISQNGNIYEAGLGAAWSLLSDYYNNPTNKSAEQALRKLNQPDGTKFQYTVGVSDPSVIEPESYTLDTALLARPGNEDIQLSYFRDYRSNEEMYPEWQAFLRERQPPLFAVWGRNDLFFVPAGAEAFRGDVREAEVRILEGGHFLLETRVEEVAGLMLGFLDRKGL